MADKNAPLERHTFAVIVDNEPGVLARVIGLFSGRGYNIESLTVAEVDRELGLSRINLVTIGTPMVIEQIKAQLGAAGAGAFGARSDRERPPCRARAGPDQGSRDRRETAPNPSASRTSSAPASSIPPPNPSSSN